MNSHTPKRVDRMNTDYEIELTEMIESMVEFSGAANVSDPEYNKVAIKLAETGKYRIIDTVGGIDRDKMQVLIKA